MLFLENEKEEEKIIGLTRANLLRRSYFLTKILIRLGARLVNIKTNKYTKKKKINNKYTRVVIIMRPNNTFISLNNQNDLYLVTAGLAGFKGPKRSSPYSRHVVARIMSRYISNQGYENIDIYFNSRITKRFYFLFKGLIKKPYNVRYIARNKMVSHGYLRKKKKRRK